MLQIKDFKIDLTNDFVLNIDDDLFTTTSAYRNFGNKQTFVNKIIDKHVRYIMLKNILIIDTN